MATTTMPTTTPTATPVHMAEKTDYEAGHKFIMDCAEVEPTDIYKFTLWTMAGMHAALFRGLKSIETQMDTDHSADHANWIGYCRSFTNTLLGHHIGEEEALFPELEKELGAQTSNVEQHHALVPPVQDFDKYLESCIADYSKWDPATVRQHIANFKGPMMNHLVEELKTLDPAILKEKCTEKGLKEADAKHMAYIQKHADPFVNLVFIRTHNGPKDHDWPHMPFVLVKVLVPYVFRWKHNGYWKYAPHGINAAHELKE